MVDVVCCRIHCCCADLRAQNSGQKSCSDNTIQQAILHHLLRQGSCADLQHYYYYYYIGGRATPTPSQLIASELI